MTKVCSLETLQAIRLKAVEKLPDALVVINRNGVIVDINEEAESLFGYVREDIIGEPVEKLMPEQYHEAHRKHIASFFRRPRRREMGRGLKLERITRDGEKVPVQIEISPLPIGGNEGGVFGLATVRGTEPPLPVPVPEPLK